MPVVGGPPRHLLQQLVVLIWGDKEAGAEAVEAVLGGVLRRGKEPHFVALHAAALNVLRHRPDKGPQAVVVLLHQGQGDGGGVVPQAVPAGPVLREGVDVGVVPVAHQLLAVPAQLVDTHIGAGRTADMQQGFHRKCTSFLPLLYRRNEVLSSYFFVLSILPRVTPRSAAAAALMRSKPTKGTTQTERERGEGFLAPRKAGRFTGRSDHSAPSR